ncbi:hypothetical protein HYH03_017440 [Edaphochlamys debaryana]|uniref:Uncharacterized protein n=1 Tax=Edaphochlamys debaryana TaxID=47281 RepID=A0A835XFP6_9CHLO|nr:hypothetical protein HYH03_017440 [Edaphochlamys debaryana]|eukprot:KAG2483722.1 hypothetical protein HYH03_017440 [Edaphochlamys debaryana]
MSGSRSQRVLVVAAQSASNGLAELCRGLLNDGVVVTVLVTGSSGTLPPLPAGVAVVLECSSGALLLDAASGQVILRDRDLGSSSTLTAALVVCCVPPEGLHLASHEERQLSQPGGDSPCTQPLPLRHGSAPRAASVGGGSSGGGVLQRLQRRLVGIPSPSPCPGPSPGHYAAPPPPWSSACNGSPSSCASTASAPTADAAAPRLACAALPWLPPSVLTELAAAAAPKPGPLPGPLPEPRLHRGLVLPALPRLAFVRMARPGAGAGPGMGGGDGPSSGVQERTEAPTGVAGEEEGETAGGGEAVRLRLQGAWLGLWATGRLSPCQGGVSCGGASPAEANASLPRGAGVASASLAGGRRISRVIPSRSRSVLHLGQMLQSLGPQPMPQATPGPDKRPSTDSSRPQSTGAARRRSVLGLLSASVWGESGGQSTSGAADISDGGGGQRPGLATDDGAGGNGGTPSSPTGTHRGAHGSGESRAQAEAEAGAGTGAEVQQQEAAELALMRREVLAATREEAWEALLAGRPPLRYWGAGMGLGQEEACSNYLHLPGPDSSMGYPAAASPGETPANSAPSRARRFSSAAQPGQGRALLPTPAAPHGPWAGSGLAIGLIGSPRDGEGDTPPTSGRGGSRSSAPRPRHSASGMPWRALAGARRRSSTAAGFSWLAAPLAFTAPVSLQGSSVATHTARTGSAGAGSDGQGSGSPVATVLGTGEHSGRQPPPAGRVFGRLLSLGHGRHRSSGLGAGAEAAAETELPWHASAAAATPTGAAAVDAKGARVRESGPGSSHAATPATAGRVSGGGALPMRRQEGLKAPAELPPTNWQDVAEAEAAVAAAIQLRLAARQRTSSTAAAPPALPPPPPPPLAQLPALQTLSACDGAAGPAGGGDPLGLDGCVASLGPGAAGLQWMGSHTDKETAATAAAALLAAGVSALAPAAAATAAAAAFSGMPLSYMSASSLLLGTNEPPPSTRENATGVTPPTRALVGDMGGGTTAGPVSAALAIAAAPNNGAMPPTSTSASLPECASLPDCGAVPGPAAFSGASAAGASANAPPRPLLPLYRLSAGGEAPLGQPPELPPRDGFGSERGSPWPGDDLPLADPALVAARWSLLSAGENSEALAAIACAAAGAGAEASSPLRLGSGLESAQLGGWEDGGDFGGARPVGAATAAASAAAAATADAACSQAVSRYGALLMASAGFRCTELYDMHDALLLSKLTERRDAGASELGPGQGEAASLNLGASALESIQTASATPGFLALGRASSGAAGLVSPDGPHPPRGRQPQSAQLPCQPSLPQPPAPATATATGSRWQRLLETVASAGAAAAASAGTWARGAPPSGGEALGAVVSATGTAQAALAETGRGGNDSEWYAFLDAGVTTHAGTPAAAAAATSAEAPAGRPCLEHEGGVAAEAAAAHRGMGRSGRALLDAVPHRPPPRRPTALADLVMRSAANVHHTAMAPTATDLAQPRSGSALHELNSARNTAAAASEWTTAGPSCSFGTAAGWSGGASGGGPQSRLLCTIVPPPHTTLSTRLVPGGRACSSGAPQPSLARPVSQQHPSAAAPAPGHEANSSGGVPSRRSLGTWSQALPHQRPRRRGHSVAGTGTAAGAADVSHGPGSGRLLATTQGLALGVLQGSPAAASGLGWAETLLALRGAAVGPEAGVGSAVLRSGSGAPGSAGVSRRSGVVGALARSLKKFMSRPRESRNGSSTDPPLLDPAPTGGEDLPSAAAAYGTSATLALYGADPHLELDPDPLATSETATLEAALQSCADGQPRCAPSTGPGGVRSGPLASESYAAQAAHVGVACPVSLPGRRPPPMQLQPPPPAAAAAAPTVSSGSTAAAAAAAAASTLGGSRGFSVRVLLSLGTPEAAAAAVSAASAAGFYRGSAPAAAARRSLQQAGVPPAAGVTALGYDAELGRLSRCTDGPVSGGGGGGGSTGPCSSLPFSAVAVGSGPPAGRRPGSGDFRPGSGDGPSWQRDDGRGAREQGRWSLDEVRRPPAICTTTAASTVWSGAGASRPGSARHMLLRTSLDAAAPPEADSGGGASGGGVRAAAWAQGSTGAARAGLQTVPGSGTGDGSGGFGGSCFDGDEASEEGAPPLLPPPRPEFCAPAAPLDPRVVCEVGSEEGELEASSSPLNTGSAAVAAGAPRAGGRSERLSGLRSPDEASPPDVGGPGGAPSPLASGLQEGELAGGGRQGSRLMGLLRGLMGTGRGSASGGSRPHSRRSSVHTPTGEAAFARGLTFEESRLNASSSASASASASAGPGSPWTGVSCGTEPGEVGPASSPLAGPHRPRSLRARSLLQRTGSLLGLSMGLGGPRSRRGSNSRSSSQLSVGGSDFGAGAGTDFTRGSVWGAGAAPAALDVSVRRGSRRAVDFIGLSDGGSSDTPSTVVSPMLRTTPALYGGGGAAAGPLTATLRAGSRHRLAVTDPAAAGPGSPPRAGFGGERPSGAAARMAALRGAASRSLKALVGSTGGAATSTAAGSSACNGAGAGVAPASPAPQALRRGRSSESLRRAKSVTNLLAAGSPGGSGRGRVEAGADVGGSPRHGPVQEARLARLAPLAASVLAPR